MAIEQLRSDLQRSRALLFDALRGLSEEQFRHEPGDAWNIATHLAHLLRCERLWAERARRALDEDEPSVHSTRAVNDDDPSLAARMAVPQILHGMVAARRDLERVLDDAGDAGLHRAVRHERLGRMTVLDMAVKVAGHEAEHGPEVARLAQMAPQARPVIIPLRPRS